MFDLLLQEFGEVSQPASPPAQVIERSVMGRREPLSIIRPHPHKRLSYTELRCTKDDQKTIHTIISNVAERGKLWLLANKSDFDQMSEEIKPVHPLKFLEVIFSNPYLSQCIEELLNDFWKRINFMPELRSSLTARYEARELLIHIEDFSEALNLDREKIEEYFLGGNWDDLVWYLIQKKNHAGSHEKQGG
ncbi:MAG: hypothetical protein AAGI90_02070 [Chlamydiota bacterium]